MNQLRLKALLASLIVSAPAYSNEIDNLVNASQSIRDSFKYGIQAVGGMHSYAVQGKIAPTGTTEGGKISYDQSDAYNQALAAVQNAVYTYNPGAQEYFDNQADQAMNEVNTAIDTFVEAIIVEGEQTAFFRTSPERGCWFAVDYEACINGA